ncbi:aldehyde dehydrogenase family protein [Streptomyces sp. SID3343]|uniref:aldehyde dehydrogenase family protein n=1 Tax=Streptomyces sp. SID3343 TaxID=2690260 RepID=UPI0019271C28
MGTAGFPLGVFNLVSGLGPEVGDAPVRHPGVDMISSTGSTTARMAINVAAGLRRVQLELGSVFNLLGLRHDVGCDSTS